MLNNKYDFFVVFSVKNANPNGDPLNGNRPRINHEGIGEISDVCIKRKIRNRFMQIGEKVLVQSDDSKLDEYNSIKERVEKTLAKSVLKDKKALAEAACKEWIDVRAFGQVFAFKGDDVSLGIRGPVSIHSAFSVNPVNVTSIQITKSVNSTENGSKKSSDTMGMKHRIDFGLYTFAGSINPQLASKTGFNDKDAELLKNALVELFENDASSARPDGSMEISKVFWWKHNNPNGQYSSAKVHRSVKIQLCEGVIEAKDIKDYLVEVDRLEGLECTVLEGK
ncbi:type I-C CRISPR-associated protein Cas7/Csd2 [Alkaliphilus pronyensis]|uniref:Type I-C CRISPR-associated protein Cas7/Csd2 n=1 Tax=Alkaliphilus pronyensis TaxID=1482732 RepID=A0A6I0EWG6_9FIRM|nr:type I-C CRISPR-associated protein Cas7/Csd2 [Alkaliphilus pronyensis]KAB3529678.1 type I-C CRISPR-associated protein Cas7/Csd2 [Alkaliphilus pronyensis]